MPPDPAVVDFPLEQAERVSQTLVDPPFLPDHEQVATQPPRIVEVRLEIVEREVEIAPGVFVWQMAFNNSVPGPAPVVFQWDWVDLTLVNGTTDTLRFGVAENTMAHNIDFHAATGALGGGALTTVAPGPTPPRHDREVPCARRRAGLPSWRPRGVDVALAIRAHRRLL